MRVIALRTLREFWESGHRAAETPLRAWYGVASKARWQSLAEVRQIFPHADPVKADSGRMLTVFNVGGNNYRLVVDIVYDLQAIYIQKVMTHAEYDKNRWKKEL
ncbi:MAG: type II toxin-antitoxin system HigB family toxin [Bacteroidota bacterium]